MSVSVSVSVSVPWNSSLMETDDERTTPNGTVSGSPEEAGGGGGGSEELSVYAKSLVIVLYAVVIVVAIGGNAGVCAIVATHRHMRTVTNYFIVSLACSDVVMATLCIPTTFVANVLVRHWPFGATLCPVVFYSQVQHRPVITTSTCG